MKIHHIGVASNNIREDCAELCGIYDVVEKSEIIYDQEQKAELCWLKIRNGLDIELVSGKTIENFLKNGIRYYHVCYEVEDIEQQMEILIQKGGINISDPKPAIIFNNRRVAFLKFQTGIIELLEAKGKEAF